jgi:hypothetical protein
MPIDKMNNSLKISEILEEIEILTFLPPLIRSDMPRGQWEERAMNVLKQISPYLLPGNTIGEINQHNEDWE